jgi:hypothetical protein
MGAGTLRNASTYRPEWATSSASVREEPVELLMDCERAVCERWGKLALKF